MGREQRTTVFTLILIGLVGGFVTGISPCVLPVLPVVFLSGGVHTERRRSSPFLVIAGLALSFSVMTLLGTLIVSALPVPSDAMRWAGLLVLVLIGTATMFPAVQAVLERPFTRIRSGRIGAPRGGFVLGLALGCVYVPCAGPILAAITVAGASGDIGVRTVALTAAFAIGTAAPLFAFAAAGRRVAERVRVFRARQRGVRTAAGLIIIALGVALTFNLSDVLQRHVPDYTASLNRALDGAGAVQALTPGHNAALDRCTATQSPHLADCGTAPAITGIEKWLNTPDGKAPGTNGKVTLVDFWAYSCINCQRTIPHLEAWYRAYRAAGLVVVGVHTPEYAFERVPDNVAAGAARLHITYPVAIDNNYSTWRHFDNGAWPTEYLIDATGMVRHVAVGEGTYGTSERLIRQLLVAARPGVTLPTPTDVRDMTPDNPYQTSEMHLGSARQTSYVYVTLPRGTTRFSFPLTLPPHQFALSGTWTVGAEQVTSGKDAAIEVRYDASDLYLDMSGTGTVTAESGGQSSTVSVSGVPNIYTLARGKPREHVVRLHVTPGLDLYSFTFG